MRFSKKARSAFKKDLSTHLMAFALFVGACGMTYTLATTSFGELAHGARSMAASTMASLTVGVAPNPTNTLAAQLAAKEQALNEREAQLAQSSGSGNVLGFASFIMSLILLVLVGINFYYDKRSRRHRGPVVPRKYSVDLR